MSEPHVNRYNLVANFQPEDVDPFIEQLGSNPGIATIEGLGNTLERVHVARNVKTGNTCDRGQEHLTDPDPIRIDHFHVLINGLVDEEVAYEQDESGEGVTITSGVEALINGLWVPTSLDIQPHPNSSIWDKPDSEHRYRLPVFKLSLGVEPISTRVTDTSRPDLAICNQCDSFI